MKALKTWWKVYARSISDPAYYNHIIRTPLSFSLKYYAFFYVLLAFVSSIYFVYKLQPQFVRTVKLVSNQIQSEYPEELVVSFDNNQMQVSGVEEPYHLPFPEEVDHESLVDSYDQFVTLDATGETEYDSLVTFRRDHASLLYPDGRELDLPYSDFEPNLTITKNSVNEELPLLEESVLGFVSLFPVGIFLFGSTVVPLAMLVALAVLTGFIYLGTQLNQLRLSYQKCYQIGLHTITFAETARFMQRVLFADFDLPSIYILAFFGSTLLVIYSLKPGKLG